MLASWPSFPPLIHEIVRSAASDRVAGRNVLVGDLLALQLTETMTDATATLSTPDDNQISLRFDGNENVWTHGQTDQPGVYRLEFEDQAIGRSLFAVNLDTSESDLEPVPFDGLASYFDTEIQPGIASSEYVERDVPLFRLALGSLLALLVAETLVACRFGRAAR